MVIELISGISRLDLNTGSRQETVNTPQTEIGNVLYRSPVVGSFSPHGFDVLRRQKQVSGEFL